MSKKKLGLCVKCGRSLIIIGNGMCSSCYHRDKAGVPTVDCFALDDTKIGGLCAVTGGKCRMQSMDSERRECSFRRTREEHASSRERAFERIRRLPEAQRVYITETYLMQKEGEE